MPGTLKHFRKKLLSQIIDGNLPLGNVVFLSHLDGDSSTYTFVDEYGHTVINPNTELRADSTTKKFGTGSCKFIGNDDKGLRLSSTSNDYILGTDDFTIEFFASAEAVTYNIYRACLSLTTSGDIGISIGISTTGYWQISTPDGNIASTVSTATAFQHIALVRKNGIIKFFVNGVAYATLASTHDFVGTILTIGASRVNSPFWYIARCWIDEIRITKNYAHYDSNFAPPTQAFAAPIFDDIYFNHVSFISNFNGSNNSQSIVDEKGHTVTVVGNAKLSTETFKYGVSSCYFDGASYLTVPADASITGASDFVAEAWVKPTNLGGYQTLIGANTTGGLMVSLNGDSSVHINLFGSAGTSHNYTFTNNLWYHIAVASFNGTLTVFVNGTAIGTQATPTAIAGTIHIGNAGTYGQYFIGYIDSMRITKTVCRYFSNYVSPLTEFVTEITNDIDTFKTYDTFMLYVKDSAIYEAKGNIFTPIVSPSIVPTVFKYGLASMYFDGASQYLAFNDPTPFDFGSGDFTVECWINTNEAAFAFNNRIMGNVNNDHGWALGINRATPSVGVQFGNGYAGIQSLSTSISLNTWHHIAISRIGTVLYLVIDGLLDNSVVIPAETVFGNDHSFFVGSCPERTISAGLDYQGYIDSIRIKKGKGLYSSSVNIPTRSFWSEIIQNSDVYESKISLLMHLTGVNNGTAFIDQKGSVATRVGSPVTQLVDDPSGYCIGGSAAYFNGSNYLSIPSNDAFALPGNFTVEFRFKPNTVNGVLELFTKGAGFQVYIYNGTMYLAISANNTTTYIVNGSFGAVVAGNWYHCAICRVGNRYYGLLNGVATLIGTSSSPPETGVSPALIGAYGSGQYLFNGLMNELCITKEGRYMGSYNVPKTAYGD